MRSSIRISVARQHCRLLVQQQVHLHRFKLFVHQRGMAKRYSPALCLRSKYAGYLWGSKERKVINPNDSMRGWVRLALRVTPEQQVLLRHAAEATGVSL